MNLDKYDWRDPSSALFLLQCDEMGIATRRLMLHKNKTSSTSSTTSTLYVAGGAILYCIYRIGKKVKDIIKDKVNSDILEEYTEDI